ncbi:class I SAM-dependent methyltransferase [Paenactinomyces guangxiensis]|uniref:Class I SAM-dependent methyltransferase n=1 Tax=Paenactinomyces guangxiensis TaxID=1490290 RepID=A0A7W1WQV8_9BACL|nr:class I SAM-dependent methyltransferase [Paenactinomyces guangxiensis]MBA4494332.1 class I SAM-dependent methyltransferase [Paenactinomyces guangxiensis]MBH8590827.1 class I SAM-dependent methyltransferase [Paenactinomyces guangxiensis]
MHRFWEKIIQPIFKKRNVQSIVEIGAASGAHTVKILKCCCERNAKLFVIDPFPQFDTASFQSIYGNRLQIWRQISLCALPQIKHYDAVLIDGDHNWYTVYHELKIIENKAKQTGKFPIVFLHDTEWPYGRRDMYYLPDTIPAHYRKPYSTKGIKAGQSQLADQGGTNQGLNNATYEGGEKNGVLTAIEDFLRETYFPIRFYRVKTNNGLGILIPNNQEDDLTIRQIIAFSGL